MLRSTLQNTIKEKDKGTDEFKKAQPFVSSVKKSLGVSFAKLRNEDSQDAIDQKPSALKLLEDIIKADNSVTNIAKIESINSKTSLVEEETSARLNKLTAKIEEITKQSDVRFSNSKLQQLIVTKDS